MGGDVNGDGSWGTPSRRVANNGRIASSVDHVAGETVNYTYDGLNRLSSAGAANGCGGRAFTYDGFGNLTGKTVTAGSVADFERELRSAANRQYGGTYDENGNPTGGCCTTWRIGCCLSAGHEQYAYDHGGKRVKKVYGENDWELYFYGVGGQKLETYVREQRDGKGAATQVQRVLRREAGEESGDRWCSTDRLGSVRVNASGETDEVLPVRGGAARHGGREGEVRDVHAG